LVLVCIAQFMVILDVSVVNVALPSIGRSLHYSPTGLQWVVNAYVLAFAGFLLLGGRAADIFGRKKIFLLSTALFTVASLVGGVATSSGMLTAARVAQGLGGAFLAPATLTIILTTFRGPSLPRALGAWGAMGGAGGAVGALLGGILTEISWRWVLFINIPIGMVLIIGALIWLPEVSHRVPDSKLDVAGAVLVTAGLTTLVYAIVGTNANPWGSSTTIGFLLASAVLLALFALVETKLATSPLVPFSFFKNRTVAVTNLAMLLIGVANFSMWYFLTLYYQEVHGWSPLRTGLAFIPQTIAVIVGAQIATRLMARIGAWPLIMTGTTLAAVSFLALSQLSSTTSYFGYVLWAAVSVSLGLALLFSPLTAAATSQAGAAQAGLASGVLNSARQIGGSLGLAILATIAAEVTRSLVPATSHTLGAATSATTRAALARGYDRAFLWSALFCFAAALVTLRIPRDVASHTRRDAVPEVA
jgi:EmrB/QacA subfamily drug resistance transporter